MRDGPLITKQNKGKLLQGYRKVTDRKHSRKESGIRVAHKLVLDMNKVMLDL